MTLKTLLLGSAAAFAVIGGAQAADLSVAEPVESVKVCDTFGSGYWYIPGSDTCLKVGGHVEFDINLHDMSETTPGHSSNWDFVTKMGLSFDASSMTDVGRLDGHIAVKGTYSGDPDTSDGFDVLADGYYLKLGALKAGHFGSTFNPDSVFTDDFGITNPIKSSLADSNQLQLSWAAAGFGLALGIEDPRESFESTLPDEYSMPLITGAITASQAAWSGRVSAGFVQLDNGSSWGVDGEITFKLDSIAAGDQLRLNVAYGDDAFIGGGLGDDTPTNDGWSAFASFQHMFSSTLRFDIDYNYLQYSDDNGTQWNAAADLVWLPYAGFKAKIGAAYTQAEGEDGVWSAQVALRRDW